MTLAFGAGRACALPLPPRCCLAQQPNGVPRHAAPRSSLPAGTAIVAAGRAIKRSARSHRWVGGRRGRMAGKPRARSAACRDAHGRFPTNALDGGDLVDIKPKREEVIQPHAHSFSWEAGRGECLPILDDTGPPLGALDALDPAGADTTREWGGPAELVFERSSSLHDTVRVFSAPAASGGCWRRLSTGEGVWQSVALLGPDGNVRRDALAMGYVKSLASMGMATIRTLGATDEMAPRVLCIGIGGGSLPLWLADNGATVDAVEIDSAVLDAAEQAMGLPHLERYEGSASEAVLRAAVGHAGSASAEQHRGSMRTFCCDGVAFVLEAARQHGRHYDAAFLDVFDGSGFVPPAFYSAAFASALGVLCRYVFVNMICTVPKHQRLDGQSAPSCVAMLDALRHGFGPSASLWTVHVNESHNLIGAVAPLAPAPAVSELEAAAYELASGGGYTFDPEWRVGYGYRCWT